MLNLMWFIFSVKGRAEPSSFLLQLQPSTVIYTININCLHNSITNITECDEGYKKL
jgi:hypothetical protein